MDRQSGKMYNMNFYISTTEMKIPSIKAKKENYVSRTDYAKLSNTKLYARTSMFKKYVRRL